MSRICESCGQVMLDAEKITDRELDVLSAWWGVRSVKVAATIAGVGEQRAKNLLANLRRRTGAETNLSVAIHFAASLRPVAEVARRRAA